MPIRLEKIVRKRQGDFFDSHCRQTVWGAAYQNICKYVQSYFPTRCVELHAVA